MRITSRFLIAAFCALAAYGQAPAPQNQQVFTFKHTDTVQDFQEVCNLIRTATMVRDVSTDNAQKTLTVLGTADQLALAGWLYKALDKTPQSQDAAVQEYRAGGDDIVHLYYIANTETVQEFQEIANLVRTSTLIRNAFTYNAARALAVRGTGDQMGLADWLVTELNQPVQQSHSSAPHQYRIPMSSTDAARYGDVVRVFYLPNTKTAQDFQEVANLVRATTNIRMAFTYSEPRALALRATSDEIALAAWLVNELNTNGQDEYRVPNASDDIVRAFYLPHTATVQDFQAIANQIRTATEIRKAFTYNAQRALVLRGTVTHLALAERMVKELDQPKQ